MILIGVPCCPPPPPSPIRPVSAATPPPSPTPAADVHINLKLHRMEVLPESDDGLKDWCMARWMEKQELLKEFTAKGKFPVGYHGVDEVGSDT